MREAPDVQPSGASLCQFPLFENPRSLVLERGEHPAPGCLVAGLAGGNEVVHGIGTALSPGDHMVCLARRSVAVLAKSSVTLNNLPSQAFPGLAEIEGWNDGMMYF